MLYAFMLEDDPARSDIRQRLRQAHVAYLQAVAEQIAFAGPFTDDDGQAMSGSLLVIEFPSRAVAQEWMAGEPYNRAGLYASSTIQTFVNRWPQKAGFPSAH
ncbi:YciI family protein [Noviherbaspirillum sedimenti]|uniref:YciI family protein n=1 Tax=Noviherbaspirillum sedimenti TaxID=2320865 RepID=A0A3A3FXW4_9BURK|nr:YciI family protein [Noviherbaspirillum sedimenti]RJG01033.1 YciI family protein [Noviherbaspirillum sedimenti]